MKKKQGHEKQNEDILNFYMSNKDYAFLVLGWCKFMIRPYITPFSNLKYSQKFYISNDDEEKYLMRVQNISIYKNICEAIDKFNYTKILPESHTLTLNMARMLAVKTLIGPRFHKYKEKHGIEPPVMIIELEPYKDPRE